MNTEDKAIVGHGAMKNSWLAPYQYSSEIIVTTNAKHPVRTEVCTIF